MAAPLGSVAVAQTSDVSAQLASEQSNEANLQQQLSLLEQQFGTIKQQHDSLQQKYKIDSDAYNASCAGRPANTGNCPSWRAQVLGEQSQLGAQILDLERQAHDLQTRGQDLKSRFDASIQRIGELQRQQSAFMQLRRAASSGEDAAQMLKDRPAAIEEAKKRSNCQFDTEACAPAKAPPRVETPTAVPAAVLADPQYRLLSARLGAERQIASKMKAEVGELRARQRREADSTKRQQIQIEIYHAENVLQTEEGRSRVTQIKAADRMKEVMGAPILKGGPGGSQAPR
ncbi:MAG: hypothetical protein ACREEB_09715 [Caulobacteraceae bacterium]